MTGEDPPGGSKPIITLDLDGVMCSPPFGYNFGIRSTFLDPGAPPRPARVPPRWWAEPFDRARFDLRRPLPGVADALSALQALRTVYVLTGRRTSPRRWLARHGLDALVDHIVINETLLRSPHFKLHTIRELGAQEHVDDDGRTAQLLAASSSLRVFLVDWPRNRGPEYHAGVVRVNALREVPALQA
jgi:phosphoglycolate phosphatase-like HAD superfamily hydrolase